MGTSPSWVTTNKTIIKQEDEIPELQYVAPTETINIIVTVYTIPKTADTITNGTIPNEDVIKCILNKSFKQECPIISCHDVVMTMSKEDFLKRTKNSKNKKGLIQEKFSGTIGLTDNVKYNNKADRFLREVTTILLCEKVPQDFECVTQWVKHMHFCLLPNDTHDPLNGAVVLGANPIVYGNSLHESSPFVETAYHAFNKLMPEEYQAESL
eukprot:15352567-Ditylum_brightwellii.AAC.1